MSELEESNVSTCYRIIATRVLGAKTETIGSTGLESSALGAGFFEIYKNQKGHVQPEVG